ncbi:MAG: EAL domain-containing protein [Chloroflexota bacterium]
MAEPKPRFTARPFASLPEPVRRLVPVGLVVLGLLIVAALANVGGMQLLWTHAHLTFAALLSTVGCLVVARSATGRTREVMGWIGAGMIFWTLAALVRGVQLLGLIGGEQEPSIADLLSLPVVPLAAVAYRAALRGRLSENEEVGVYLDAAIVFLATTAALIIFFGAAASQRVDGVVDLAYAIFFLAMGLATLLLNLALLVERRVRGPYLILLGVLLLGGAFLWHHATDLMVDLQGESLAQGVLSAGIVLVMLGTVTWTDKADEDPNYVRMAARLRGGLPIGAVGVTPVLLVALLLQPEPGLFTEVLAGSALACLLVTVALRQSFLSRTRESSITREQELLRHVSQTEAKYRSLVEQQRGVVYLAEPGARGRWHYVSPQIESMLGFTADEWTSDPSLFARQVHPDDRDRVAAAETAAGESGRPDRLEYRMLRRDGGEVWVLDDLNKAPPDPDYPALLQGIMLDITEQKHAEAALRASEDQLRLIIETASYAFVGMDPSGTIVEWNHQAERIFGWTREEALDQRLDELIIPPAQREAHRTGLAHYLATGDGPILSRRIEVLALHRDGREFPVDLTIWPVGSGTELRFNALVDDITVRKQLEEQLRDRALHDPLTSLANPVLFMDRVQRALELAAASERGSVAILFIDLDDFKLINSSLGRSAGDELIVAVARRIESDLQPADSSARIGGEEFAVLVEGVDRARPARLAARLLTLIAEPFEIDGKSVQISASIGIALDGPGSSSPEELLRNANLAMSSAKAKGRGHSELYAGRMHRASLRRMEVKAALEAAIADEQLEVHYQPIVRVADGLITGFEALLRWFDADDQPMPLEEVISIAEESGLIVPIGRMVLRRACAEAVTWKLRPITGAVDVAVNISAGQLDDGALVTDVRGALDESGLPPSSLILEMTESALIEESVTTIRSLHQLRAMGVRLALDDFGTGYSSLTHLRRFPIDIVKIDRSFVASVTRPRGGALVRSIIDLGRTMNLAIIAEGIETGAQLEALQAMDCVLGQGFYFGRAATADETRAVLEAHRLPVEPERGRRLRTA